MKKLKFSVVCCFAFLSLLTIAAQAQTSTTTNLTTELTAGGFSTLVSGIGSCSDPVFVMTSPNSVSVTQSCTCGAATTQITSFTLPNPLPVGSTGPLPGPLALPMTVAVSEEVINPCNLFKPVAIGVQPLPVATIGLNYHYSAKIFAGQGTPPYTWTVRNLPQGFNQVDDPGSGAVVIDAPTLMLPLTDQTIPLQVTVQDSAGGSDTKVFQLQLQKVPSDLTIKLPELDAVINLVGEVFDTVHQEVAYTSEGRPVPAYSTEEDVVYVSWHVLSNALNGTIQPDFGFLQGVDPELLLKAAEFMAGMYGTLYDIELSVPVEIGDGGATGAVIFGSNVVHIYNLAEFMVNYGYLDSTIFMKEVQTDVFDFYSLAGAVAALNQEHILPGQVKPPVLHPITTKPPTFVEFGPGPYILDPPISYGYEYRMYAGAGFQSVQVPQSCASVAFPLVYQQADGTQGSAVVQPGATYTFATPVLDFKVTRMVPTTTCTPFLTTVGFAGSDYEVLQETAIPIAFADVLADITYAFQNGWINNFAVASTLYLEVLGAQKTTGCPQNVLLKVFTKEVSVESGKHINSQGVALLLNDASLLAGQLSAQKGACPAAN